MSSTYSDNGYNGESPLVSSLPSLVSITTSLPVYGLSRKEDNDAFDSIYYNPPAEVKREPLSPRIPTPLPPPIVNKVTCRTKSPVTTSPSTPLTEPPTPDNLWLGANFRASYNIWGNTVNNPYVEPEVGPAFTWPPPPLMKYIAKNPNMMLGNAYAKHLAFLDQQETQAHQGVQAALELWMSWARRREQHVNMNANRDWLQVALVFQRAPPPLNQDLYIPRTIDFNGPLLSTSAKPSTNGVTKLTEFPGPSWDERNKLTGSQKLAFQEKYWA
ncbi:hypothetical protein JAAARDRAFT_197919 [Jaapia argillacea MUCL 33604]|uniref:Uncharacterized protein n=1 Tax=Jaapia argillacea MUCL 33604 TaxID=933084 RepID=A0A067PD55_9AGAM|nr:hypothetical protein JAAARDRAFT_197919 [Jaapia argillacea MUCL 33604]